LGVLLPSRAWRRERSSRVFQSSKGFIHISFLGRDCAFVALHAEDGWPANRLARPIRPDRTVVDRALKRLGVPAAEAAKLAERIVIDWPYERKRVAGLLLAGFAGWILSLVGAASVARRLFRAVMR
jgi:hypothetical protein